MIIGLSSCKSPMQRWLDSMTDFAEVKGNAYKIQAARITTGIEDTTTLNYKVRIYLGKAVTSKGYDESVNFYYHMDSCFLVRTMGGNELPVLVQPVNNGISGCYEYLVSMDISKAMRLKKLELIYQDKFIDGKRYILNLN
ncbi:MAG: hypothetical protein ACHQHN_04250 [Sphingobacteriales bacterium]